MSKRLKTILAGALAAAVLIAALGVWAASGPDREIVFVRESPSQVSEQTLSLSMSSVGNWPKWFYILGKATRINLMGAPLPQADQSAEKGALVQLEFDPGKGARKRFEMRVKITDYVPGRRLAFALVEDRSGRIARMFEDLQWEIEVVPGTPTIVRATERVRTKHWRSRLLTRLAERTMMNQLLYPNVMALSEFTQPVGPNPYPIYGQ